MLDRSVHQSWRGVNRLPFETLARSINGGKEYTVPAMNALLSCKRALSFTGIKARNQRERINQLTRLQSSVGVNDAHKHMQSREPLQPKSYAEDIKLIRRMVYRASTGSRHCLSRAARMTGQGKLADPTPAMVQKFKSLLLPAGDPLPSPTIHPSRPPPIMTPDLLRKAIGRGVGCDAACGPLGMTGELLEPLLQDYDTTNGIVALLNEMLRGTLPAPIARMVSAPRFIASNKPDGGIRPIGMGDLFYKLAAHTAVKAVEPSFGKIFPRIQYGLGIRGGPQVAFHRIQRAIESSDVSACVTFDVKNAFNSRDRAAIARAIIDIPELHPVWPSFRTIYGRENVGLMYDASGKLVERLTFANGVIQGDVLASLVFNASMQRPYEQVVDGIELMEVAAVHDDFTAVGIAASIAEVVGRFAAMCEREKITPAWQKCTILWPHPTAIPTELREVCDQYGMRIVTGSMELLGGVVGNDRVSIQNKLTTHISSKITADSLASSTILKCLCRWRGCWQYRLRSRRYHILHLSTGIAIWWTAFSGSIDRLRKCVCGDALTYREAHQSMHVMLNRPRSLYV